MYYVYIIRSTLTQGYYIGSCEDLDVRLKRHNKGYVNSTSKARPWEIIYTEKYDSLKEARKRERQIKNWKSRSAIEKLLDRK